MLHLEKTLSRTSLNHISDDHNYALIYQPFHINTDDWTQIKTELRTQSPSCQWKLSSNHQISQYDGPVFFIFDHSWENLQAIYTRLKSMKSLNCIGAIFLAQPISLQEIELIQKTTKPSIYSLLIGNQCGILPWLNTPQTELLNTLHYCSLSDLNR